MPATCRSDADIVTDIIDLIRPKLAPQFQRRHYTAIAHVIRMARTSADGRINPQSLSDTIELFARVFSLDNSRFDANRFRTACGETEE